MTPQRRLVAALCYAALIGTLFSATHVTTYAALPAPASKPPLYAVVARNGDIFIRRGETQTLVTVRAGIFEPGWAYRAAILDAGIAATTAGSTVTVKPSVVSDGKVLRVSVSLTADKDTPVNSAHVSVNVLASGYVGGAAVWKGGDGTKTYPLTTVPGAVRIMEGKNGAIALAKPDGSGALTVTASGSTGLFLQDNRSFGGSDFEIRVGGITEHTLKAGQTETVSFTIELPDAASIVEEKPLVLQASADWIPLSPKSLEIVSGSALDFSGFLSDAPAGKYGHMITRPDGHFAFEKKRGKSERFYGVNLAFTANYLEHVEADQLARRLQRLGYNTVRIHHYEGDLIEPKATDSLTFRPEQLDKLDYLVAALKKRGIYIKTDLFVSRPIRPAEMGLAEGGADDYKDAVLVSRPAMENWKAFSKKLLTHVNPYTGLAYKDEPALAWISLINEPNLTNGRLSAWKPDLRALFTAEWRTWYAARYPGTAQPIPALPTSIEDNATGRDVGAFFAFLHQRGWDEMSGFLRKEIGTRALLTYLNGWSETPAFLVTRQSFDFVDNHFYWDHPNFLAKSWGFPSTGWSANGSAAASDGLGLAAVAMTRLYGKPFTVSEWDYVFPNRYRADGSVIMGAVSALQDWDAIWHFAYSHGRDSVNAPQRADYFNMAQDPLRQASERVGILLFLREDVKPSNRVVASTVAPKQLIGPTKAGYMFLRSADYMTNSKFGINVTDVTPPAVSGVTFGRGGGVAPAYPPARARGTSAAHQIVTAVKATGQFVVSTDKTVAVTLEPGAAWKDGAVAVRAAGSRAEITISTLEGDAIASSKRLLVTHLTDLQNTGEKFSSPDRLILEGLGELPYLVRRGSATITLTRPDAAKLKAWRLDTTGKRISPIPVRVANGAATVSLSTLAPDGSATLYYELATP